MTPSYEDSAPETGGNVTDSLPPLVAANDDGVFVFGLGAGETSIDGGERTGYDTIRLKGVGWPARGDWTIYFTHGGVRFDGVSEWPQDGVVAVIARPQWILSPASSGVIQLKDGSRLVFRGIERIIWGEGSIISTTGGPPPLPDQRSFAAE